MAWSKREHDANWAKGEVNSGVQDTEHTEIAGGFSGLRAQDGAAPISKRIFPALFQGRACIQASGHKQFSGLRIKAVHDWAGK